LWQSYKRENPEAEAAITEGSVPDLWRETVGEQIASVTKVEFRKGILYLSVGSSVLRSELFVRREAFRTELNRRLGSELVRNVIIR